MMRKMDTAKPVRVLFVHAQTTSHDCGGSFRVLHFLLKGIDHDRFDARVVLSFTDEPHPAPDSPAFRLIEECGMKSQSLRVPMNQMSASPMFFLKYVMNLLLSTWKLFRLIRREKIEIVYTNSLNILASGIAARLAGVRSIYHIHENVHKPRVVARVLKRVAAALADTLICVSEAVKASFLDAGVAANKLVTVTNCIDLDRFSDVHTGEKVRREFAPTGDEKLVASIGRVVPKKGHHYVIEAAGKVVHQYPSARFLIVGASRTEKDEYLQSLIDQVKQKGLNGHVIFTGQRDDMPEIMAAADVVVLASGSDATPEASPLVIVEALAMGTPVVASNLGGVPEILHDGETGYLVPPRDAEALASAILRLLQHEDVAQAMGRAGQAWVRNHMNAGRYAHKIQSILLQTMSN
ncbi:MAG: glycosyltransferase [candidate division KSB1 bacterium]|nr:glycosyltransferase [candidate division KSB1 bacterium]MDZ7305323.1 glycosyltransferase [candidate division KSB1 bacterium]